MYVITYFVFHNTEVKNNSKWNYFIDPNRPKPNHLRERKNDILPQRGIDVDYMSEKISNPYKLWHWKTQVAEHIAWIFFLKASEVFIKYPYLIALGYVHLLGNLNVIIYFKMPNSFLLLIF